MSESIAISPARTAVMATSLAALAALLLAFVRFLGGSGGLTQALPVTWGDLLLLSPCPLLAATVALVAARFAAMQVLGSGRGKA